jgi:DNA polymerase I-like protein with 3'-5' exonuclease and polymerase domains
MKVFNSPHLGRAKVAIVKTYIKGASDLLKIGKKLKEYEISPKDVVWISLYDEKPTKVSVGDLRSKVLELEELLKSSNINIVADITSKKDKTKYTTGLLFKDIFNRDNDLWKDKGILETTIGSWSGKFICGIRWESIKREMEMKELIDSEFLIKEDMIKIIIPKTKEEIKSAFNIINKGKNISFDTEASGLKPFSKTFLLYTLQFTSDRDKNISYIFMYEHPKFHVEDSLKKLIEKGTLHIMYNKKIWIHNASYDLLVLKAKMDIDFYKVDIYDTMIIYHFLTNTYVQVPLGLKNICFSQGLFYDWESQLDVYKKEYCSSNKMKVDDFKYEYFELGDLIQYAGYDTIALAHLVDRLYEMCEEHIAYKQEGLHVINETWEQHWQPIMQSLYQVMTNGLPFNMEKAIKLRDKNINRITEIDEAIESNPFVKNAEKIINKRNFDKAMVTYNKKVQEAESKGKVFKGAKPDWDKGKYGSISYNVKFSTTSNAHKEILFIDVLKMKVLERTETGNPKLSDDIIGEYAELRPDIDILCLFSEKAKLVKLLGTYIEPWINLVEDDRDGRLRSTFNPLATSGRLRCSNPNLLNIPKHGGLKDLIEADYKKGNVVGQVDISALEERASLLQHQDPVKLKMKEVNVEDMHSVSAITISKAKQDGKLEHLDATIPEHLKIVKGDFPDLRQGGKALTFGIQFLCSYKSIMFTYGVDEPTARSILSNHWNTFKGEKAFLDMKVRKFNKEGYDIMFGRIPILTPNVILDMEDKDNMNKIRPCYNAVSGQSSAYSVLRALDWTMREFNDKNLRWTPILSVYDSIIFESPIDNILEVVEKLRYNMSEPFIENQLFPLQHETEIGKAYKPEFILDIDIEIAKQQILEFKESLEKV